MRVLPRIWCLLVALVVVGTPAIAAQQTVKLGVVIATFLAEQGTRAGALPWTIGGTLPVTWQSASPTETDAEGYTLGLNGTTQVMLEGHAPVPVTIQLLGSNAGIERVTLAFDWKDPDIGIVQKTLVADGVQLAPLRCDQKTEPKAGGNVLFEARADGKVPVGLAVAWSCAPAGCAAGLSILYRRDDVNSIRCMAAA